MISKAVGGTLSSMGATYGADTVGGILSIARVGALVGSDVIGVSVGVRVGVLVGRRLGIPPGSQLGSISQSLVFALHRWPGQHVRGLFLLLEPQSVARSLSRAHLAALIADSVGGILSIARVGDLVGSDVIGVRVGVLVGR